MRSESAGRSQPDFQYVRLADEIEAKIREGDYLAGEKLPSLRMLHRQLGLSISTVYQGYIELERRGVVESRTKSGFYVTPASLNVLPAPTLRRHRAVPKRVRISDLTDAIVQAMSDPSVLNLGGAAPNEGLMAGRALARTIKTIPAADLERLVVHYERPSGHSELKRQIARSVLGMAGGVTADEVVITNGCLEAVGLCLRAVTSPGDAVLVESPTFHGFLQLIEDLNLYALEVPTHPDDGVDPDLLERAVMENDVRACLLTPNFQNPLGSLMPDDRKQAIVRFLNRKGIPLIEDDIYGDLHFDSKRPLPLAAFDRRGLVLYCSSFSKTLAAGLRVGWVFPGRFGDRVRRIKVNANLGSAGLNQFVVARFIKHGGYDRHLRRLRNTLKNQMGNTARAIARYFPEGTKVTAPRGGLLLWVQLHRGMDGMALYHEARRRGISILPGTLCSTTKAYRNCIRINCGQPWDERLERGIATLGRLIHGMTAAVSS